MSSTSLREAPTLLLTNYVHHLPLSLHRKPRGQIGGAQTGGRTVSPELAVTMGECIYLFKKIIIKPLSVGYVFNQCNPYSELSVLAHNP